VCQQTYYILSRLINASLSDGETGEGSGEPVAIDGGLVERIEFVSPWKMVIVLRNGKRIAVEPDFYNEIRYCSEDDGDECFLENLFLRIYEDGDEGE